MKRESERERRARETARKHKAAATPSSNGKPRDGWPDHLRGDSYEGPLNGDTGCEEKPPEEPVLKSYTLGELVSTYPEMREPVVHGLLRVGETMNVIAAPKVGKSWTVANLAFAVATGRDWLGFNTCAGDVLIVDNELHPETLANRLRRVAEANGIDLATVAERITILPLRGKLQNLIALGSYFKAQIPGRFRLVIIDAYYRTLPPDLDENDNAAVAGLYNVVDQYADHLRGSFVLIHHASKGNQSAKAITDVGSGAGSQSRAADTHLILRPHAEHGVVVLDAAVRSFPSVNPRCLRWKFPAFVPADELDPAELAENAPRRRRKSDKDDEPSWDAKRFAETFGRIEPRTRALILSEAGDAGLSDRKAEMLLKGAIDREFLFASQPGGASKPMLLSRSKPS